MQKPSLSLMTQARARALLRDIDQLFSDAAYWNDKNRKPHEEKIDIDPNGELRQLAASLENFLKETA